ncbi:M48 family metalloprotease [Reichenbachiella sp.]|uniref:M48 family metallopeptidase n=1 Tax=Reichenbachiella sp. TaxID=2184521 RepID=UPI003297BE10
MRYSAFAIFIYILLPIVHAQSQNVIRRTVSSDQAYINRQYQHHNSIYPKREKRDGVYLNYCKKVNSGMIKLIGAGQFFDDANLSTYLNEIKKKLLDSNDLKTNHIHLIVDRSYMVNAKALGNCSIIINNGLLSVLDTEEELAYVIAHEIAHLELDHIYEKVIRAKESDINEDARRILLGEAKREQMDEFKEKVYYTASYNRQLEKEADSLGLHLYLNVYRNTTAPLNALSKLKMIGNHSTLAEELFRPFNFKKNPFDFHLLREDISIFSKESDRVLFLARDSLLSHPEMEERKNALSERLSKLERDTIVQQKIDWISRSSKYENVFYSSEKKFYALALYEALRLKHEYPRDKEISTYIIQLLHKLHDDKRDGLFELYFSRYTKGYPQDLLMVHNFIRNISYQELIGISYNYLGLTRNFDADNSEHYKLLISTCEKMNQEKQADLIRQAYFQKFKTKLE